LDPYEGPLKEFFNEIITKRPDLIEAFINEWEDILIHASFIGALVDWPNAFRIANLPVLLKGKLRETEGGELAFAYGLAEYYAHNDRWGDACKVFQKIIDSFEEERYDNEIWDANLTDPDAVDRDSLWGNMFPCFRLPPPTIEAVRRRAQECISKAIKCNRGEKSILQKNEVIRWLHRDNKNLRKVCAVLKRNEYNVFKDLENKLRIFIQKNLLKYYKNKDDAWNKGIPESIRLKASPRKEKARAPEAHKWKYLDFIDYPEIIKQGWGNIFCKHCNLEGRDNRERVITPLYKLNEIRNATMHFRPPSNNEQRKQLEDYYAYFCKIYNRWKSRGY